MVSDNSQSIRNACFFIAVSATVVALGGALAHVFEFPHKMTMTQEEYFVTRQIYGGWNGLSYVLLLKLLGITGVIISYRHAPTVI